MARPEDFPAMPDLEDWPMYVHMGEEPAVVMATLGTYVVFDRAGPAVVFADGRYELPVLFEALVDWPDIPRCQLRIGIRPTGPVCLKLALVRRPGESQLRAAQIRIPLDQIVKKVTVALGAGLADSSFAEFERELAAMAPRPEPGKRLRDEHFKQVADVYRYAIRLGRPATAAVGEAFDVSRSTAGRWIVETRRRGFLGPAVPGRAGEQADEGKENDA